MFASVERTRGSFPPGLFITESEELHEARRIGVGEEELAFIRLTRGTITRYGDLPKSVFDGNRFRSKEGMKRIILFPGHEAETSPVKPRIVFPWFARHQVDFYVTAAFSPGTGQGELVFLCRLD